MNDKPRDIELVSGRASVQSEIAQHPRLVGKPLCLPLDSEALTSRAYLRTADQPWAPLSPLPTTLWSVPASHLSCCFLATRASAVISGFWHSSSAWRRQPQQGELWT